MKEQHQIQLAILCAMKVCGNATFHEWAENYLSGEDQTKESIFRISEYLTNQKKSANEAVDSAAQVEMYEGERLDSIVRFYSYCAAIDAVNSTFPAHETVDFYCDKAWSFARTASTFITNKQCSNQSN